MKIGDLVSIRPIFGRPLDKTIGVVILEAEYEGYKGPKPMRTFCIQWFADRPQQWWDEDDLELVSESW